MHVPDNAIMSVSPYVGPEKKQTCKLVYADLLVLQLELKIWRHQSPSKRQWRFTVTTALYPRRYVSWSLLSVVLKRI